MYIHNPGSIMLTKRRGGVLLKETDEERKTRRKAVSAALHASKKEDRKRQSERKKPRQTELVQVTWKGKAGCLLTKVSQVMLKVQVVAMTWL